MHTKTKNPKANNQQDRNLGISVIDGVRYVNAFSNLQNGSYDSLENPVSFLQFVMLIFPVVKPEYRLKRVNSYTLSFSPDQLLMFTTVKECNDFFTHCPVCLKEGE